MVLRATGPCSSTDRRTTLALVRRRSESAARGTRDGEGREGEVREEEVREEEVREEGEAGARVGAAARGMAIILGELVRHCAVS
ncbi:hypothetical protein GCM10012282_42450 [Streptomyces lacrimifluminis]|uniref:Uncharacterized protein n=1 Tax=Streptomyces lacrimifluminis TaxID=1500077 RepID=A0A917L1Y6_9ACTN|nr:hypothetical protein GCM10012282_42450 [Streptomyces lacrimifluminis]